MIDIKGKERSPEETVEYFREIFKGIGIEFDEKILHCVDGAYSMRITAKNLGWGVNGKGTTENYCRASAYGEAMERFQNRTVCEYRYVPEGDGFFRWPDETLKDPEVVREIPDLWEDFRRLRGDDDPAFDREIIACDNRDGKISTIPYWSLKDGKTVKLPTFLMRLMHGSNGLAAGNTYTEALCQGLSEITERYVKHRILKEKLTPPEIPDSFLPDTILNLRNAIEKHSGFQLRIIDLSLGLGLPVAGLQVLDKSRQRYQVQFGSHPYLPIAVERCMTELLQGYDPANPLQADYHMTPWNANSSEVFLPRNIAASHCIGYLTVPDEFWGGTPSWEFHPWGTELHSNDENAEYLLRLMKDLAGNVYLRNNGFLGVPAFHIYVPGISSMPYPLTKESPYLEDMQNQLRNFGRMPLSDTDAKRLLDSLENDNLVIGCYSDKCTCSINCAKALLHLRFHEFEKAARLMKSPAGRKEEILSRALRLQQKGFPAEERFAVLSRFYEEKEVSFAENILADPEKAVERFFDPTGLLTLIRNVKKSGQDENRILAEDTMQIVWERMRDKMKTGIPEQNISLWFSEETDIPGIHTGKGEE